MAEKNQQSLSSFMKKQISDKSKQQAKSKSVKKIADAKNAQKQGEESPDQENPEQEEMTDEEKLEDAKKASRNKAAEFDQSGMIKKMVIEAIAKYTLLIAIVVVVMIGLIQFGPTLLKALNGLISKILMGALHGGK